MSGYTEGIITLLCINAIAAMGVSLLTGFTGIFSLGHAAYMALGAYTSAILTVHYGVHWLPAILLGGGVAVIVAYGIGIPTLRLMGDYFAIASIGLGEAIRLILENWQSLTRGARGYPGIEPYTTLPVALTFFVIMALCMFNLINSRYGRAFKACRDDYVAASLLGFHTARLRVLSLMISAFIVEWPELFLPVFFLYTTHYVRYAEVHRVNGRGGFEALIYGRDHGRNFVITLVTELFRPISQYRMLIYGAVLVIIMVIRPEGIMGGLNGGGY